MNKLNWLLTYTSLSVLLVTIERFSPTTKILLQPYNFLRLHELIQMAVVILLTIIIPFFMFKHLSHNFENLKSKNNFYLLLTFTIGVYFYATGNGLHEIASFLFNNYCDVKNFQGSLCGSLFFNDYYTGNIIYFFGGILMVTPLLALEKLKPQTKIDRKNLLILVINALIYSLTIFAYSAFDRVLVGLVYSIIMTIIICGFYFSIRKKSLNHPFTLYSLITYGIGTIASTLVRFQN